MSQKNSYTTASYIPWDTAIILVRRLYKNKQYRMSLLIGCGIFFGLRIGDLLTLRWNQILHDEEFIIVEHKTGKRRLIRINKGFQHHIQECYNAIGVTNEYQHCFLNKYGSVISIQTINKQLKLIKVQFQLRIDNFSTHSLRKTWARKIYENENAEGRGEIALLKLSEIMNHSAPNITRKYIGLRQQELGEVYDALTF